MLMLIPLLGPPRDTNASTGTIFALMGGIATVTNVVVIQNGHGPSSLTSPVDWDNSPPLVPSIVAAIAVSFRRVVVAIVTSSSQDFVWTLVSGIVA